MNMSVCRGEGKRLEILRALQVLDTPAEEVFDELTAAAAQILRAPLAAVSLVDSNRQWFKSSVGLGVSETDREIAFCDFTIRADLPFVVEDARADLRFRLNPLVVDDPGIRFYLGVPLTVEHQRIGSLCVIDREPRPFDADEVAVLVGLGRVAERLLADRLVTG